MSEFKSIVEIVKKLRGKYGCPWDRAQTHQTLTSYAIEEVYELVEAIEFGDDQSLVEELGDVLLQVILHSEIARQEKRFDIEDVVQAISQKMLARHPHVFGDQKAKTADEAIKHFNSAKDKEIKNSKAHPKAKTSGPFNIPTALPALQRSHKIGVKTARVGFDWKTPNEVLEKVNEEMLELQQEFKSTKKVNKASDNKKIREELGDLLFSMAQLARHLDMDPEQVLREANGKFESRYEKMLTLAKKKKLDFVKLSTAEKEKLWQAIKNKNEKGR